MGVDSTTSTALPLPTPTDTTESIVAPSELLSESQSDASRINQESYSLPNDGTPVTIKTRGHHHARSQTSLLIEYFEAGKPSAGASGSATTSTATRQPDVRVRLIPSKRGRRNSTGNNNSSDDQGRITITETKSSSGRKASLSRRRAAPSAASVASAISAAGAASASSQPESDPVDAEDNNSMNSYASATEESAVSRNYPIDIEIDRSGYGRGRPRNQRPTSPLIPQIPHPTESNLSFRPDASEISDIPADSFLDDDHGRKSENFDSHVPAALFIGGSAAGASSSAMGESWDRNRDRSVADRSVTDRSVTDRDQDRLSNTKVRGEYRDRDRDSRGGVSKNRPSKSQSRSRKTSSEVRGESSNTSRRRTSRGYHDSVVSAADTARSYDQHSTVSAASKTSINNPKLLETVEDAIRRLILPELSALKREQSKRESRRGSITSTTTASRDEDVDRRKADRRAESAHDGVRKKERRNRDAARHAYGDSSPLGFDPDSQSESVSFIDDLDTTASSRPRGSAAGGGALLTVDDRDRRQRRRRRAEHARSQSVGGGGGAGDGSSVAEDYPDDHSYLSPPMPLMSDINPSEMTRTSLLSVDSDRPLSAAAEKDAPHDASRADMSAVSAASDMSTPTQARSPFGFPYNLSTKHANISHGDLTTLARRRTGELEGAVARRQAAALREGRVLGEDEYLEEEEEEEHIAEYGDDDDDDDDEYGYSQYPQDTYAYQQHVLSPIPSEAEGSEVSSRQNSRTGAHSPAKSYRSETPSMVHSMVQSMAASMAPSNFLAVGGFNNAKESEVGGARSAYAEESEVGQKPVNKVSANPRVINVPFGVESAVASLVDGSVMTESHIAYPRDRAPVEEYDDHSRSATPSALSVDSRRNQPQAFDEEYEPDDYGHKKRYQPSPLQTNRHQASSDAEAAITAGAVAALRAKSKQQQQQQQQQAQVVDQKNASPGVSRAFSFQQRGNDEESLSARTPTRTPTRSNGLPDWNDPLPEAEYVRHSLVDGEWDDGRRTPTQRSVDGKGHPLTAEAMAGVPGQGGDRSEEDRKRDTIVTNPYEDTSPTTNPGLHANLRGLANYANGFNTGSPGLHVNKLLDEGYMSQGATRTPEPRQQPINGRLADPFVATPDSLNKASSQSPAYLRNLSAAGMPQGMQSPMYDGASSMDLDNIESRDIVSLMQFLMARDAKKDANEGALVQALIQTAVEMQSSFTDIKKLLAQTRDEINENTDRTVYKAINGPRPYPGGVGVGGPGGNVRSMTMNSSPNTQEELNANLKKQGIFRRALKGLSNKGTNDLGRIEDMFNQLLSEVDVLKSQTAPALSTPQSSTGHASFDHVQAQQEATRYDDRGYEPEGLAGTSTNASQPGPLSSAHSRNLSNAGSALLNPNQTSRSTSPGPGLAPTPTRQQGFERKYSDLRISTVPEGDEETVSRRNTPSNSIGHLRGNSVPVGSPVDVSSPITQQGTASHDNTPKAEKNRKSKSSSWFPKISRWSETTTSSVQRVFRSSANSKRDAKESAEWTPRQPSRSGSSLNDDRSFDDDDDDDGDDDISDLSDDTDGDSQQVHSVIDPYGEDNLPVGYSNADLPSQNGGAPLDSREQPGSHPPPMPRGYMMTPEDPKYKAHRNSLNLQHPQPRPGQTERFRNALEYSAQEFMPSSPRSEAWGGSMTSLNRLPPNQNQIRYVETQLQPLQTEPNWRTASPVGTGPPRPPKEPMEESTPRSRISRQKDYTGSPKLQNRNLGNAMAGGPARRPSGPRAMTPKNDDEAATALARDDRQRKRNTFGVLASHGSDGY